MTNKLISYKRILCPVDYADHSLAAVQHAISISAKFGSRITLLNIFKLPDVAALTGVSSETIEYERNQLEAFAEEVSAPGINMEFHVRMGHIGQEIIDTAEQVNADLIVMGSHGYSGLQRIILGSTAEYILEHSNIPAMIIRI